MSQDEIDPNEYEEQDPQRDESFIDVSAFPSSIKAFSFSGLKHVLPDAVLRASEVEEGETGDLGKVFEVVQRARQNLNDTGCFSQIDALLLTPEEYAAYCSRNSLSPSDSLSSPSPEKAFVSAVEGGEGRPLVLHLDLKEKERKFTLSLETKAGQSSGSFGGKFVVRNLFGRFEELKAETSYETRLSDFVPTRHYNVEFKKKMLSSRTIREMAVAVGSVEEKMGDTSGYESYGRSASLSLLSHSHHRLLYQLSLRSNSLLPHRPSSSSSSSSSSSGSSGSSVASYPVGIEGGTDVKSSISHEFTLDHRDSPTLPTSGSALRLYHELAGLGGTTSFFKQEIAIQPNFSLPLGLALNTYGRFGWVKTWRGRESVRINDRFFLNTESIRGFAPRSVGPNKGGVSMGGDMYMAVGAHLSIPFPQPVPPFVRAHIFANVANLSQSLPKQNVYRQIRKLGDMEEMRASAGVGMVFDAQVGRLELNLCHPFSSSPSDIPKEWQISFSLGLL